MAQQPRPPSAAPAPFTWEGDATLHSYCYDYMRKRGWMETASRFAQDAGIDEASWSGPPIEAPQGLLYEWWSVFWDVFIARSQKAGQRNPNADTYVEAMRAKRDPVLVQFTGPNPPQPVNLPRSLAHPSRAASQAGAPPRAQFNQMHVLEQQELQNQMQQRGRVQQVHIQRGVPGQPPQPGYPPQGPQPPHPQQGGPPPQGQMPPYPPQNPHQPPSAHSSPHMVPASHPYANGRPPGPPQHPHQGMPPQNAPGPLSQTMVSAMAAVGLGGRDPDSLSQEEHAAVAAQMRRMGALPPTPQQAGQMRNGPPPQQVRVVQRLPPDAQMRQQGYPGVPPQGQPMMQDRLPHPPQQMMMQQGPMPPQQRMPPQGGQYGPGPGQVGSPASPAYSAGPSPYATPLVANMQIPPPISQSSPSQFNPPLPPPSRNAKGRLPSAGGLPPPQGSPAQGLPPGVNPNAKRLGGNMDEPSPRSRKRVRGGTRDEEMFAQGEMEQMGPGSPGGMMGMPPGPPGAQGFGPDGIPYRPSPSPSLMQPPEGKGRAGPPGLGPPPQQMYSMGPSPGAQYTDMGVNGLPQPPMNGQGGHLSRPASAASNHHFLGPPPGPDQRLSPAPMQQGGMPPPPGSHASPNGTLPAPPGNFDPNAGIPVGNSRPFAGGALSASSTPLPAPPIGLPPQPDQSQANGIPVGGGDDSFLLNTSGGNGDTTFEGLDFESFLNNDMFADDGTS
ncbi:hypothetical protein JCM10207_008379 [Rhodosporidiobolus poonsookiae]